MKYKAEVMVNGNIVRNIVITSNHPHNAVVQALKGISAPSILLYVMNERGENWTHKITTQGNLMLSKTIYKDHYLPNKDEIDCVFSGNMKISEVSKS